METEELENPCKDVKIVINRFGDYCFTFQNPEQGQRIR